MSVNLLLEKIRQKNCPVVAGLDPLLSYVPEYIREKSFKEYGPSLQGAAEAIFDFNRELIDGLYDIIPAVKPQSAYYELYGPVGVSVLKRTIDYAKSKGLYVIADIKRNDIGSTAEAYAKAYLGSTDIGGGEISAFGVDAATVNGYLGTDGIEPFLKECRKGKMIFVLVKTSNPSSGELQDLKVGDRTIYEIMAQRVETWGKTAPGEEKYTQVGAVVGATYPEQMKTLREQMPNTFFLVPGYGAQGATAKDIAFAFDEKGEGAVINSSRGIMCAYKKGYGEKDFVKAARDEAVNMREAILQEIKERY